MSRTDKDRPYWVRSNDTAEARVVHHSQRGVGAHIPCWEQCTINTSTARPRHEWRTRSHAIRPTPSCGYFVDVSRTWNNTPSRKDRRQGFYGPARRAEREYTRAVQNTYNVHGSLWEEQEEINLNEVGNVDMKRYWRW